MCGCQVRLEASLKELQAALQRSEADNAKAIAATEKVCRLFPAFVNNIPFLVRRVSLGLPGGALFVNE